MSTELHWVEGPWPGRMALSARPRGGEWLAGEMLHWKEDGVDTVVSMLERTESADLELAEEGSEAIVHGMQFRSLPIVDRQVPDSKMEFVRRLAELEKELKVGHNLALHCRQGVGRTGLVAACLLILNGVTPSQAVSLLSEARGVAVPETAAQRQWLDDFAESFAWCDDAASPQAVAQRRSLEPGEVDDLWTLGYGRT